MHIPRHQSSANVYHVFSRGTGKSIIFEDDEDRRFFMRLARKLMHAENIECFAWCLMGNHFHFLLHGKTESISSMMQDLCSAYAKFFNQKYDRIGALFQGSFCSVPIEGDRQALIVARYIHVNPVKSGLPIEYRWSSYREYLKSPYFTSTKFLIDVSESREAFIDFHCAINSVPNSTSDLSDQIMLESMRDALNGISPLTIQSFSKPERDRYVSLLKCAGFSVRQIQRATGIGKSTIHRA